MEKKPDISAAVCQFDVKPGEIDTNCKAAITAIRHAGKKGAGLTVLPELWSCGFDIQNMARHAERTPEILNRMSGVAAENHIIIAGSLPELSEDAVYNTLFVIDAAGAIAAAYRKIHLFSLMDEDSCFSRGNSAVICRTAGIDLGMMICYDLRFPELCRTLAVNGAQIMIISAQWPAVRIEHWDILLRARAIENQVFIIAANCCGNSADATFNGHSRIISPLGEILADAGEIPGEVIAAIDFREIEAVRKRFSTIAERVPDAYK